MFDIIVIGGGAAGFFGAIQAAKANPRLKIAIFERGKTVLGKVKVSGGGRCNVAHAVFEPLPLTENYPRGQKELIGPFHSYASGDTMQFFEEHGVPLKIEEDGRIFPVSNSSQSIIDCFLNEAENLGITILKNSSVKAFVRSHEIENGWQVTTMNKHYQCRKLMVATGSNPKIWNQLNQLGHTIVSPLPSLFTFNCKDSRIQGLQGLSKNGVVEILAKRSYTSEISIPLKSKVEKEPILTQSGPLLITHWGFSGPAVLKLSAWGARELHKFHYHFKIKINWMPEFNLGTMIGYLNEVKMVEAKKTVAKAKVLEIPSRLWARLVKAAGIETYQKWADLNKESIHALASQLTEGKFRIEGKSTFKEEFVTAGGVDLKEINFKTFESKILPNLFLAGEVINVDAVTGGFNFQNAWTGSYIAAQAMAKD